MDGVEFRQVSVGAFSPDANSRWIHAGVEAGEVVALVGRSGAGKTTVLKLVNRLLAARRRDGARAGPGHARVGSDSVCAARVGYVIQEVGLFPHMTVADNIAVVPRLEGWESGRVGARVRELLELVGLATATLRRRAGPTSCRAVSGSASASRARSPSIRRCC